MFKISVAKILITALFLKIMFITDFEDVLFLNFSRFFLTFPQTASVHL
jgi:hypothetical protein